MFGALAYNQNKVDSEEAKVLFSNKMLLSENGNFSIGECMRSFEMQMPVQLSTKKPILHISINPHPEDVLTDQQLSDKQIIELVTKRKTGLIKGFKGKNGKAFDASLVLDEQFNVGFSFPKKKEKPKK